MLTPEGNLLLAGGKAYPADNSDDNFSSHAMALLLPVGGQDSIISATSPWLWWVLAGVAAVCLLLCISRFKRQGQPKMMPFPAEDNKGADMDLMQRLYQLMEEHKPYLNSELKLQEVADLLGTNRTYLSAGIKTATGQSFTQFVNKYRVEYAKELLMQHPEEKMSAIWAESGFSTESSFFRTFKAVTGSTPGEWRGKVD